MGGYFSTSNLSTLCTSASESCKWIALEFLRVEGVTCMLSWSAVSASRTPVGYPPFAHLPRDGVHEATSGDHKRYKCSHIHCEIIRCGDIPVLNCNQERQKAPDRQAGLVRNDKLFHLFSMSFPGADSATLDHMVIFSTLYCFLILHIVVSSQSKCNSLFDLRDRAQIKYWESWKARWWR